MRVLGTFGVLLASPCMALLKNPKCTDALSALTGRQEKLVHPAVTAAPWLQFSPLLYIPSAQVDPNYLRHLHATGYRQAE